MPMEVHDPLFNIAIKLYCMLVSEQFLFWLYLQNWAGSALWKFLYLKMASMSLIRAQNSCGSKKISLKEEAVWILLFWPLNEHSNLNIDFTKQNINFSEIKPTLPKFILLQEKQWCDLYIYINLSRNFVQNRFHSNMTSYGPKGAITKSMYFVKL